MHDIHNIEEENENSAIEIRKLRGESRTKKKENASILAQKDAMEMEKSNME